MTYFYIHIISDKSRPTVYSWVHLERRRKHLFKRFKIQKCSCAHNSCYSMVMFPLTQWVHLKCVSAWRGPSHPQCAGVDQSRVFTFAIMPTCFLWRFSMAKNLSSQTTLCQQKVKNHSQLHWMLANIVGITVCCQKLSWKSTTSEEVICDPELHTTRYSCFECIFWKGCLCSCHSWFCGFLKSRRSWPMWQHFKDDWIMDYINLYYIILYILLFWDVLGMGSAFGTSVHIYLRFTGLRSVCSALTLVVSRIARIAGFA